MVAKMTRLSQRRTIVDDIFDHLYEEIVSLQLKPGARISEAEIAAQFGVSRQPVRDAFSRLANQDLLLIRPQRATEVRRFSAREIEKSRFLRAAVEREVLRCAAQSCGLKDAKQLDDALDAQSKAIENQDFEGFVALDYAFHQLLCEIARVDFAFDIIQAEKSKVDRLCRLSFSKEDRMPQLMTDHKAMADAIKSHNADAAIDAGMVHLSRLDETIEYISMQNTDYFEPA